MPPERTTVITALVPLSAMLKLPDAKASKESFSSICNTVVGGISKDAPPVAFESVKKTVRLGRTCASSITGTTKLRSVSPWLKIRVPPTGR